MIKNYNKKYYVCQLKEYFMIEVKKTTLENEIKDITLEKLNFNVNELEPGAVIRLRVPDYEYEYNIVRQIFEQITKLLPDNVTLVFVPEKMELEKE